MTASTIHDILVADIVCDFASSDFFRSKVRLFIDELLPMLKRRKLSITEFAAPQLHIASLVFLLKYGLVSKAIARKVLGVMCTNGADTPAQIVARNGWVQLNSRAEVEPLVDAAIYEHPKAASDWRKGKKNAVNVLRGAVMGLCNGRANPRVLNEVLEDRR